MWKKGLLKQEQFSVTKEIHFKRTSFYSSESSIQYVFLVPEQLLKPNLNILLLDFRQFRGRWQPIAEIEIVLHIVNCRLDIYRPCFFPTWTLWQYGLSSFQAGGTKFLPKNQHTKGKLLNFENWCNGEVSKIGHHFRI